MEKLVYVLWGEGSPDSGDALRDSLLGETAPRLRQLGGRCAIHSNSKREYDAHMAVLARAYLASGADKALHAFLRMNYSQLVHRHGSVVGR